MKKRAARRNTARKAQVLNRWGDAPLQVWRGVQFARPMPLALREPKR